MDSRIGHRAWRWVTLLALACFLSRGAVAQSDPQGGPLPPMVALPPSLPQAALITDPGRASPIPTQISDPSAPASAHRQTAGAASESSPSIDSAVPAAAEPLKPIADGSSGPAPVEAASFKGVTPGASNLEEVQKAWGSPKEVTQKNGTVVHLYRVEPFDRVELSFLKDKVTSMVIRLERSFPANAVAQQLDLGSIRPVLISNALGEILGQCFPERGVLFAFEPVPAGEKPSMKVAHIILEPITAEPFVLRAETHLDGKPETCLADLDQAIKLAPTNARAHWLRARVLTSLDELAKALAAIDEAIRLEPDNGRYRVTRAQVLGHSGRISDAMQEAQKAIAVSEKRAHVKARALCLLGDLAGSGAQPDYKRALGYHTDAIKTAEALTGSPHPAIRLPAKEVLVDAHLGAAHDIAWGAWNQKEVAVGKWLQKAAAAADDLIQKDGGSVEYRFRVASRALTAHVGVQGKLDPSEWTEQAVKAGQETIAAASDRSIQQQFQWDLGMALYDAVQLYQLRKEHAAALRYGKQAADLLENGLARRNSAADQYFLGRLYFRLGAIHAISEQKDHRSAVEWFDKAVALLDKSSSGVETAEKGRLGETMVSMGVSYWEVGQKDKAVDLTSRGVNWMEKAAKDGTLDKTALDIPYSNLATMFRHLGKADEANRYLQKAGKTPDTIRR